MPKKLPENTEARYQVRLARTNAQNSATGHSERARYIEVATQEVIKWTYATLPRSEFDRIHEKHMREICSLQDQIELRGNNAEWREQLGVIDGRWLQYQHTNNADPPAPVLCDWWAELIAPIAHKPVPVPDKDLGLRWSRPIRNVANSEVDRMAQLRDINLTRAGIGRRQVQVAQNSLVVVRATPSMSLGAAFGF